MGLEKLDENLKAELCFRKPTEFVCYELVPVSRNLCIYLN
jgi:hypothetical protein